MSAKVFWHGGRPDWLINGQPAEHWESHALAGYAQAKAENDKVPDVEIWLTAHEDHVTGALYKVTTVRDLRPPED